MPPEVRREIETGMATLEALKAAPLEVYWFSVSPPASLAAWVPAPATGRFRLSEDVLLKDDAESWTISAADLARQPRRDRATRSSSRLFHAAH